MSEPIDESAPIRRGAPPKSVSLRREVLFEGRLVHSLDYLVLLHVLYEISAGGEITVPKLWKQLQALDIRSAKKEDVLVGRDAVYKSFSRIIEAGYILRTEEPHPEGKGYRGRVVYVAFEDPEDNEEWVLERAAAAAEAASAEMETSTSSQVSPLPEYREAVGANATSSAVSAGRTASRVAGSGYSGSGYPGSGKRHVPAGQSTSRVSGTTVPSPPHPPEGEEVNTSSPNPLIRRSDRRRSAKPTTTTVETAAELLASEFLQGLPGRWQCGPKTAKRLSKLLADTTAEQGWTLDDALAAQLTGGKQAFDSLPGTLRSRIEDLPRFRAAPVPGQARGVTAAPPMDVCERCSHTDPRPGWVYSKHPVTGADLTVRCTHVPVAP